MSCADSILPIFEAHAGQELEIRLESDPFIDPSSGIDGVTSSVAFDDIALMVTSGSTQVVPEPHIFTSLGMVFAALLFRHR
jgi:hypothetical protein